MKYAIVVNKITDAIKTTLGEVPSRGGFYNWMKVFKGELLQHSSDIDYEKYDVLHINMPPSDQPVVPMIRRIIGNNTDTKIVGNNDYVAEAWGRWGFHPEQYWMIQRQCDMVFGTEETQASHMIEGAKIIPHPHKIDDLKHMMPDEVENNYGVLFHWWEGKTFTPGIIGLRLKDTFPKLTSNVYAYRLDKDRTSRWTKTMFDNLIPSMDFPEYIDHLMTNKFVYEPTSCHTYGRNTVDCAAIGVPMIGSNTVASMRRCFPYTSFDPYDVKKTIESAKRLLTDEDFRDQVIIHSKEHSEYYNYKNSKERFLRALEESE